MSSSRPPNFMSNTYRQWATAGLILTEGTLISPQAIGFINVSSLLTELQIEGWRAVTTAVHSEGGAIFAQIAHSGAVSHPDFFDGGLFPATSVVNPRLKSFTPDGFKDPSRHAPCPSRKIKSTIGDYAALAAKNAKAAGVDGVELLDPRTLLGPSRCELLWERLLS